MHEQQTIWGSTEGKEAAVTIKKRQPDEHSGGGRAGENRHKNRQGA